MKEAALNQIKGIFRAFEWINSTTNQIFVFEIHLLRAFAELQEATDYLSQWHSQDPGEMIAVLSDATDEWQSVLYKALERWFFKFQFYYARERGKLVKKDRLNYFDLSTDLYKETVIEEIIEEFYKLSEFETCYRVRFDIQQTFYEGAYQDLLLCAKDCSVFVHFGVSD